MKRKVLKVGNASLAVSLPKDWADLHKLKPGQEIEVEEDQGSLVISTSKNDTKDEITITIPKNEGFAKRMLYVPYIHGYNKIILKFEDGKLRSMVEHAKDLMLGFDIIDQTKNSITLQNIAQGMEESFQTAYMRLIHLTKMIGEEIIVSMKEKDYTRVEEIKNYEWMSNKFNLFCKRLINTKMRQATWSLTAHYRVITSYEDIADHYRDIYLLMAKKKAVDLIVLKWMEQLQTFHDEFLKLYNKPTVVKLLRIIDNAYKRQEGLLEAMHKSKVNAQYLMHLYHINEHFRTITEEIVPPVEK